MEYSEAQKNAICHDTGPMMVLAGPGSGKTLVITRRTKHLIEQCGVNPGKILVITFTKAAAKEMKDRFDKLMKGNNYPVVFGTFHSVFFNILRIAYNYGANNIIREEEIYRFISSMIEKYNLTIEDEKEFVTGIMSEISLIKGEMIDVSNYYSINCPNDVFRSIYHEYESMLKNSRKLDFDDMLVETYKLFVNHKNVLDSWRERFEYILIDEFQDINRIQYEIIRLLAAPKNNLFIVGDDDQSIYRFRGAKPEIMLNFTNDYKDAKTVTLAANYRCTKNIVDSAVRVVKNNKKRYKKDIYTENETGEPVDIIQFDNIKKENEKVIEEIRRLAAGNTKLSEIAVLYRTNTQPRALVEKMMEYNIPFKIRDTMPCIYDHWIAKNVMDYIKVACCKEQYIDRAIFMRIANRPNRYIGRDAMSRPVVSFDELFSYYSDKTWMIDRISKFRHDLRMISKMTPYTAISYIRNGIGYDEYLKDYADYRRMNVDDLYEILEELSAAAKDYTDYDEWFKHIEKYKEELAKKAKEQENSYSPSVTMATFHGAKGLEFENVFIIDANEGITPHHKSIKEEDIEEERRMFYVAMTRAKKNLHIYCVRERYNKELTPSRFVGEVFIDKEMLKPGTVIWHSVYKKGRILSFDGGRLQVKFDKMAVAKVLDVNYCISNGLIRLCEEP